MTKQVISLKWLDDNLNQVEISIAGNDDNEPLRVVYPCVQDCNWGKYEDMLDNVLFKIRELLEKYCGAIFGPYGILRNSSEVLAALVRWKLNVDNSQIAIKVDPMPIKARERLKEHLEQMALGWELSSSIMTKETDNILHIANAFAEYIIDTGMWLFDFNISEDSKSFLSINKDALELTWYAFNHDEKNVERKKNAVVCNKDKKSWTLSTIKAHARLFDKFKVDELN